MSTKLHETFLMVSDLEMSIEFYSDVIGLPIQSQSGRSATVGSELRGLKLSREFDEETLEAFGLSALSDERGDGIIITIEVENVDAAYARASNFDSCKTLIEPRDVQWGRRIFLVEDPDGYTIEAFNPQNESNT